MVLGYATLASSLLTLATPLLVMHAGLWALVSVRVLVGLAQGVLFPCINPIIVRCRILCS